CADDIGGRSLSRQAFRFDPGSHDPGWILRRGNRNMDGRILLRSDPWLSRELPGGRLGDVYLGITDLEGQAKSGAAGEISSSQLMATTGDPRHKILMISA